MEKSASSVEKEAVCAEIDTVTGTMDFWRVYSGEDISEEDAREMIENVTALFRLLDRWERNSTATRASPSEICP